MEALRGLGSPAALQRGRQRTPAVAGVAILFTGRYPRSIFGFNVGVMRWTWRVSFSSRSTFGAQLVIVGILAGGVGMHFGNLIGLLALVAAVILAATGRYPQDVFDPVMGFNRWCYRVLAYVALMRDENLPFRLDSGGTDPGHAAAAPTPPTPEPMPAAS